MLKELLLATALLSPVSPPSIVRGFEPPVSAFGPGHRGVDYAAVLGQPVRSPLAGVVTFVGRINDRSVVTVTSGGMQLSMEPVLATVRIGDVIAAGEVIGNVGPGGHCALRCVHLGIRIDGAYVDPSMSRRRLLPY